MCPFVHGSDYTSVYKPVTNVILVTFPTPLCRHCAHSRDPLIYNSLALETPFISHWTKLNMTLCLIETCGEAGIACAQIVPHLHILLISYSEPTVTKPQPAQVAF